MLVFAITFLTGRRLPPPIDVRLLHGHALSVCFHAAKPGKWTAAKTKNRALSGVIGHIGAIRPAFRYRKTSNRYRKMSNRYRKMSNRYRKMSNRDRRVLSRKHTPRKPGNC